MTKANWGTKRNCPACGAAFYDLNHVPATCPKCKHEFDPTVMARGRKKTGKRGAGEENDAMLQAAFSSKKSAAAKKSKKGGDDADVGDSIGELMEMDDVDDIESLHELSELEEMEDTSVNEDDADEEALIEELDTGDNVIVENVEDEEAMALDQELEDEQEEGPKKKKGKK